MVHYALIAGVPVSILNMQLACSEIERRIRAKQGGYVIFRDVNGIVQTAHDSSLLQAHRDAACVTPDGMPIVWLLRFKGFKHVARVCGPDMLLEFCKRYEHSGFRHYFYGSTDGVTEKLIKQLKLQFLDLQVCGHYCPPLRPVDALPNFEDIMRIRSAAPDIVWVGLGTPKQELWMQQHSPHLPHCVLMGVGAAFDIQAGVKRRAPKWMQRYGLEWSYRLMLEPSRLARRYLVGIPHFFILLLTRGC